MTLRKNHGREWSAPDEEICRPKQNRDWKEIAEAASKEQDGTKLLELTKQLLAALDNRRVAT